MDKNILLLFQFCDSSFPIGSFSHSFGLESYIQEQYVYDMNTFKEWLKVYIKEQLIYSDGLAARLVYEAVEIKDTQKIWMIDRQLHVQNLPRETREGNRRMGENMIKLVNSLYDIPILSEYEKRIIQKISFWHPAVIFSMLGFYLHASKSTTILFYLYSTVINLIQNAVRAIPLGQSEGQILIKDCQILLFEAVEKIQILKECDFGLVSPGLEISQMRHERVPIRIFMS